MKSVRFCVAAAALGALATSSVSAQPLFQDQFSDSVWRWYARQGEDGDVASGNVAETGGNLILSGGTTSNAADLFTTLETPIAATAAANFTAATNAVNDDFSISLGASLPPTDRGGVGFINTTGATNGWNLQLYANGAPTGSPVAIASAIPAGTALRLTVERTAGGQISAELHDVSGAPALLGTFPATAEPPGLSSIGHPVVSSRGGTVTISNITFYGATGNTLLADSFSNGTVYPEWFGEPDADTTGYMSCFNMAQIRIGATRADLQTPGYLTIRANPADGLNYSRVNTRITPSSGLNAGFPAIQALGNIDVRAKVLFPAIGANNNSVFEIGLRSNGNENPRFAVLLYPASSGTVNGAANPSLHIVSGRNYGSAGTPIASTSLSGLISFAGSNPAYVIARVTGTGAGATITAYASTNGTAATGSQITATGASLSSLAATGQVVLSAGQGDGTFVAQLDSFEVWQYNTVPAELSVFSAE
jgi:hypothetical protein